tara:strand:- start:1969 stop:2463 length:495 start_codon:yes stop_codon:yes gene_type:complete
MKKSFLISLIIFSSVSVFAQTETEVIRLSEPIQQTDEVEVFGEEISLDLLTPMSLSQIIVGEKPSTSVTLKTSVAEVCSKKGCFFIAQDGEYTARITFKDYGFFIPTDSQGKEVILVGDFSVKILSEEKAKHYAEDAGNDPEGIKGEQKEYSVVATSVVVPKSK